MLKRWIVTASAVGALCVAFSAQAQARRVSACWCRLRRAARSLSDQLTTPMFHGTNS